MYTEIFNQLVDNDVLVDSLNKFQTYYKELITYNEKVNLTAITDEQEVFIKHFFDSCLSHKNIPQSSKVVDIGTGAGFPGVPLKIIRDDIKLTLVDSLNKRITFLNELKEKLQINYDTYHSRAEDFSSNSKHREQYDVAVSRAVARLNTLLEYCLPLVKVGGIFISYKAGDIDQEINESKNALKILGGQILKIEKLNLPNNFGERSLVIIKKIKNTPNKYPRNKNLPKLKPL